MPYRAEYIWIDGTKPTAKLRSKTKIVADGETPPIWGFDGSSTNQAPGDASDCVLKPVFECPDPIRGGNNVLVMNEVLLPNMKPHPTNTRAACVKSPNNYYLNCRKNRAITGQSVRRLPFLFSILERV